MAKTIYSISYVSCFLFVTLVCSRSKVDATWMVEKRMLLQRPTWCVATGGLSDEILERVISYVCYQGGVNCNVIKPGGPCFEPDTKYDHASFVLNMFRLAHHGSCPTEVGQVISIDPSHGACKYPSMVLEIEKRANSF